MPFDLSPFLRPAGECLQKLHAALNDQQIKCELLVVRDVRHRYQALAADPQIAPKHLAYYAASSIAAVTRMSLLAFSPANAKR